DRSVSQAGREAAGAASGGAALPAGGLRTGPAGRAGPRGRPRRSRPLAAPYCGFRTTRRHLMDKLDLRKPRAEEHERSFYSLRLAEWRIAFESYLGYTAIFFLHERIRGQLAQQGAPCALTGASSVATAAF